MSYKQISNLQDWFFGWYPYLRDALSDLGTPLNSCFVWLLEQPQAPKEKVKAGAGKEEGEITKNSLVRQQLKFVLKRLTGSPMVGFFAALCGCSPCLSQAAQLSVLP